MGEDLSFVTLANSGRNEWLLQRKRAIGASDVPALMGESAWRDRTSVIADKLGQGALFEGNLKTYWGRIMEPAILQGFSELADVHLVPNTCMLVNPEIEGLAATPDALCDLSLPGPMAKDLPYIELDKLFHSSYTTFLKAKRLGHKAVVDVKCVASKGRSKWNKPEHPPEEYYGQLQAQMLVTGYPVGFLVAKVDAAELYAYAIEADEYYQSMIVQEVTRAWSEIRSYRALDQ